MKKPLVVIGGPTASGKTKLSIELAKRIDGEIISADSMQVYKYMDIGTAKPTVDEMEGIPHYLIDELYPDEEFNVAVFQRKAKDYIQGIHAKGKIPILVGGTGFYIQAVVNDIDFTETNVDTSLREVLYKEAEELGSEALHLRLREIDPVAADSIHPNNVKRVVRALEFFQQTGQKISAHNEQERQKTSPYQTAFMMLHMERDILYTRINDRVDQMLRDGLVEEVRFLLEQGYGPELVSMKGLGYKEIIPYLKGENSLEEAVYILKRDTRHFAKRQLTWFRGQCEGLWLDVGKDGYNLKEIIPNIIKYIEEIGIVI